MALHSLLCAQWIMARLGTEERRHKGRLKLPRVVRVRPSEPGLIDFDEILPTQNAAQDSVYFGRMPRKTASTSFPETKSTKKVCASSSPIPTQRLRARSIRNHWVRSFESMNSITAAAVLPYRYSCPSIWAPKKPFAKSPRCFSQLFMPSGASIHFPIPSEYLANTVPRP